MEYLGKLHESVSKFPMSEIWMDSCGKKELEYGIERGCTGATCNPVIVAKVVKSEFEYWLPYIKEIIERNPSFSEEDVAWELIYEVGRQRSVLLMDVFKEYKGKKGRLSLQVNAKNYRNTEKMLEQALYINSLAENMQVKIPATAAGIKAIEEATYNGISINATVSFTVPQAIAVAEAVERGMNRREAEGLSCEMMNPVCTLMCGRVDDWLKQDAVDRKTVYKPESLEWAGVAVVKEAYRLYKERRYRTRILTAANRNVYHWAEFIGGDILQTINYGWQLRLEDCPYEVKDNMSNSVNPEYLEDLKTNKEFIKAFDENGQTPEEFSEYGAAKTCLAGFIKIYDEYVADIRKIMI